MSQTAAWNAGPLTWGYGPPVFEIFLEPNLPFLHEGVCRHRAGRHEQLALLRRVIEFRRHRPSDARHRLTTNYEIAS